MILHSRICLSLLLSTCLLAAPAFAAPITLCGWVSNPTPGNWSLIDRKTEWTILMQGDGHADDFELPNFSKSWVVTNGSSYGYGCACMKVELAAESERITKILSTKVLPLATCKKDKTLPRHP